jgi:hypothetical protein
MSRLSKAWLRVAALLIGATGLLLVGAALAILLRDVRAADGTPCGNPWHAVRGDLPEGGEQPQGYFQALHDSCSDQGWSSLRYAASAGIGGVVLVVAPGVAAVGYRRVGAHPRRLTSRAVVGGR